MNRVTIGTDDEVKRLQFDEWMTSGSTYEVEIDGGAETVGEGELILLLPREYERHLPRDMREVTPVVAARASLSTENGKTLGVLSTNTDVLAILSQRLAGEVVSLEACLHSTTHAENVAVGRASLTLVRTASGVPTGAAVLYRGERGTGVSGITPYGEDGDGNRIYKITLTDGSYSLIIVPRGASGRPGIDAAVGWVKCSDGLWHNVIGKPDETGVYVFEIGDETAETSPWDAFSTSVNKIADRAEAAAGRASDHSDESAWYAQHSKDAKIAAEESEEQAAESARVAAREKESAATFAQSAENSHNGALAIYNQTVAIAGLANNARELAEQEAAKARLSAEQADMSAGLPLLTILPFVTASDSRWTPLADRRWVAGADAINAVIRLREMFDAGTIRRVWPNSLEVRSVTSDPGEGMTVDWHTENARYVGNSECWLEGLSFATDGNPLESFELSTEFVYDGVNDTSQRPFFVSDGNASGYRLMVVLKKYSSYDRIGLYVGKTSWNVVSTEAAIQTTLAAGTTYRLKFGYADGAYTLSLDELQDGEYVNKGQYNSGEKILGEFDTVKVGGTAGMKCSGCEYLIGKTTWRVNGADVYAGGRDQVLFYDVSSATGRPDIVADMKSFDVKSLVAPVFVFDDADGSEGLMVPYSDATFNSIGLPVVWMCRVS